jgi:hypothetical protein
LEKVVDVSEEPISIYLHYVLSCIVTCHVIKSRGMRWAGHVACIEDRRGAYRVSVGRSEGKRRLGRPKRRWKDNITIDLQEMRWCGMEWIDLAEDRDR